MRLRFHAATLPDDQAATALDQIIRLPKERSGKERKRRERYVPRLTPMCSALDRPPAHSARESRARTGGAPPAILPVEEGERRRRGINPRLAGLPARPTAGVARSPPLEEEARGWRGHQRVARCGPAVEAVRQPVAAAAASIGGE